MEWTKKMPSKVNKKSKAPSSIDVARRAGVSQAAVSRTFANQGNVSEKTRAKVMTAAAELGYHPSVIPRIMLTHRSNLVAVAVGGMYNPFNSSILEQFATRLQAIGYQMILVHIERGESLEDVMPRLAGYKVDALFIARGVIDAATARSLARYRIPIVAFHVPMQGEWISSVCCDNVDAGRRIAELFVRRGARLCAYIGGVPEGPSTAARLEGFHQRLRELGMPEPRLANAPFTYEGGMGAATELLDTGPIPDAIFCTNDLIAIGCMNSIRKRGMDVPGDIMVAGFDDIPEAVWDNNSLTTFKQSGPTMVDVSLDILKEVAAAQSSSQGKSVVVPVQLIERASTRRNGTPLP